MALDNSRRIEIIQGKIAEEERKAARIKVQLGDARTQRQAALSAIPTSDGRRRKAARKGRKYIGVLHSEREFRRHSQRMYDLEQEHKKILHQIGKYQKDIGKLRRAQVRTR